eukprot:1184054-Prorocentrum_minimum.AAC.7
MKDRKYEERKKNDICSKTAFLGMYYIGCRCSYTRCWVAPRRGRYKHCVVAVAVGPRFGVLERISCDLVVGCLRRDPKDGLVKPEMD